MLGYVGPGTGGVGPGGAFLPFGSPGIEEGRVVDLSPSVAAFESLFASYGYPGRFDPRQTAFGVNADGTVFAQGTFDPGTVLNFRGERDPSFNDRFYTYNETSFDYMSLPLERRSAFGRASFEFSHAAELYAQALYADYTAELQLWPTAMFSNVRMPSTNPYIPPDLKLLLDSRTDPDADVVIDKRLSVLGPRVVSFEYDVNQTTLGLRGEILDGWSYDIYLQIGANDQMETQSGDALTSKIEELTFAPDGGESICGGFNPFAVGAISAQCADYIAFGGTNRAEVDQTIFEASVSGQLLQLPAGELHFVLGTFYKKDKYFYDGDAVAATFLPDGRPDSLGFNATDDLSGEDENADLYVEASIPLLADRAAARSLEVVVGYRYSDYVSAGGVDAWKAELLYRPVDSFLLRSSLQHAVRAPSVYELYQPQLPAVFFGFGEPIDPCEFESSERTGPYGLQVEDLCLAQGVPLSRLPTFSDPDNDAKGFVGGNPDLKPEIADTLTLGAVFTSPFHQAWLDRLQVSLDWYRIEVDGAIATVFAGNFIARCFDPTFNPEFDAANEWCNMFSRNPGGDIVDAYEILRNSAGLRTSGLDLQLEWWLDMGPGELSLNWLVSYVDSFERLEAQAIPATDFVGTVGSDFIGTSFPEWKWNLGLSYSWQALTLNAGWHYIGGMKDANPDISPEFQIPHYDYFDVGASYDFDEGLLAGLLLRAGIENVADEDPPIIPSWNQANTEASQYDVLGRRYYVKLSYSF